MKYRYITNEVFEKTTSKLLYNEFNRDRLDIVLEDNGVYWVEDRGASKRARDIAVRETKRIFPNLVWLYDLKEYYTKIRPL